MSKVDAGQYLQLHGYLHDSLIEETVVKVLGFKDKWMMTTEAENATLGLAWYKMLEDGMLHAYHNRARHLNQLLLEKFSDVEAVILEIGAKYLCDPRGKTGISVRPRTANLGPYWSHFGFTITNAVSPMDDAEKTDDGLEIVHMDYEGLSPYPAKLFSEETRAYSVVISFETPEAGGGLKVFPARFLGNRFNAPSIACGANKDPGFESLCRGELMEPVNLKYAPGTVTIIDSFMPHAVEPCKCTEAKPRRMVCVVHYLYLESPFPHFEYWF